MNYAKVAIATTSDGIEPVTGRLYQLGVTGTEIEDEKDFNEFIDEHMGRWDYIDDGLKSKMAGETRVFVYLPCDPSGNKMLEAIRQSISELKEMDTGSLFGRLEISVENVPDGWAENWKKFYKATRAGKNFVVVPVWENYIKSDGDIVIKIDPGMAFGTGSHESTKLCLSSLESVPAKGISMLDIGTGSGILAIGALKLGAKCAVGVDIDSMAVREAEKNARLNGVEKRFEAKCGDLASGVNGRYGIICANIVADIIIRLAPDILKFLTPDGVFISSGIIDTREEEVTEAINNCGLSVFDVKRDHGWVCLLSRPCK